MSAAARKVSDNPSNLAQESTNMQV